MSVILGINIKKTYTIQKKIILGYIICRYVEAFHRGLSMSRGQCCHKKCIRAPPWKAPSVGHLFIEHRH